MPAATENAAVEQQAINALSHLNDKDKAKVLEYIANLIALEEIKNDQTGPT